MPDLDKRTPVTLLSGFLGAGKTTVLNNLIRQPDSGRIAVIMNEFGDVGLDHDLIEDVSGDIVLMHAGCLCCSIRGDLAKTMAQLLSRRDQGELDFDRVVIETTGIADPAPIVNTLTTDGLIASRYQLDGVVVLADAASGPDTLEQHAEAFCQLAVADTIVISKSDLVSADALAQYESRIEHINPSARVVRSQHGKVPLSDLFGLSAMRSDASKAEIDQWLGTRNQSAKATSSDHDIESASIEVADPIAPEAFDDWLVTLLALKGPHILRMKGIVHVEGMKWPFVFHGVQHIFDSPVPLKSWSSNDTRSRVVLIARDMSKGELEASLNPLLGRVSTPEEGGDETWLERTGTSP
ncbi:MAG: GTP-binding protein [Pseudomonadota bacterium]